MRSAVTAVLVAALMVVGGVGVGKAAEKSPAFEHVHTLAFDAAGRALWLGAHAGLYRSEDDGRTWRAVNSGLRGLDVHGLAIDPNAPAKLHALVREQGAGLYRTTDGGAKWIRVDDGAAGETKVLASVDIPTGMGGIFLYAGTGDGLQRNPDCF